MKSKTFMRMLLLVAMVAFASPAFSSDAVTVPVAKTESPEEHIARLERRLDEIKAMDVDKLTRAEKKALRVEVRQIKKEAKAVTGVYISVGALLIIILLIVLFA